MNGSKQHQKGLSSSSVKGYLEPEKRANPRLYNHTVRGLNDVTRTQSLRSNFFPPMRQGFSTYLCAMQVSAWNTHFDLCIIYSVQYQKGLLPEVFMETLMFVLPRLSFGLYSGWFQGVSVWYRMACLSRYLIYQYFWEETAKASQIDTKRRETVSSFLVLENSNKVHHFSPKKICTANVSQFPCQNKLETPGRDDLLYIKNCLDFSQVEYAR